MSCRTSSILNSDTNWHANQIAVQSVPPQLPQIPISGGGGGILERPRQQFYPMQHETGALEISQHQMEGNYIPNTNPLVANLQLVKSCSCPPSSTSCRIGFNLCRSYARRNHFTQFQVFELRRVFERQRYPNRMERTELAQRIGLTVKQVSIRLTIIIAV